MNVCVLALSLPAFSTHTVQDLLSREWHSEQVLPPELLEAKQFPHRSPMDQPD